MIWQTALDSGSRGVASRLCLFSFPAVLPLCGRLTISPPSQAGRRRCSCASSLRGPCGEWETPAAGGEERASPRGKEAKGPGCPFAAPPFPPKTGRATPALGLRGRDPAARAPARAFPQVAALAFEVWCPLQTCSRAAPRLCSHQDAGPNPGRTPKRCPLRAREAALTEAP